jgi:predicted DNA-binding transcriptional regulator AlpA
MNDTLLSTKQVSERYGFSKAWLERQRWLGTGPKFIKIGSRMVRYRASDIEEYLGRCEVSPAA